MFWRDPFVFSLLGDTVVLRVHLTQSLISEFSYVSGGVVMSPRSVPTGGERFAWYWPKEGTASIASPWMSLGVSVAVEAHEMTAHYCIWRLSTSFPIFLHVLGLRWHSRYHYRPFRDRCVEQARGCDPDRVRIGCGFIYISVNPTPVFLVSGNTYLAY